METMIESIVQRTDSIDVVQRAVERMNNGDHPHLAINIEMILLVATTELVSVSVAIVQHKRNQL